MSTEENNTKKEELVEPVKPIDITIKGVIADLANGLTRFKGTQEDKLYNPSIGSIEEKYGISKADVTTIFKHSALKGLRTKSQKPTFNLVDDRTEDEKTVSAKTAFGKPSESTVRELEKTKDELPKAKVEIEKVETPF